MSEQTTEASTSSHEFEQTAPYWSASLSLVCRLFFFDRFLTADFLPPVVNCTRPPTDVGDFTLLTRRTRADVVVSVAKVGLTGEAVVSERLPACPPV